MKLLIGHLEYTVRPFRDGDEGRGINWGEADVRAQEILLAAEMSPDRQLEVLIHEIVHAAWDAYSVPVRVNEEQVACFVGNALAAAIRANPHLLPVLMALREGAGFLGE